MDLRNILNTEGGASRAPPAQARSMSMTIPGDQFPPPPRIPQRAQSTASEMSPISQHDVLQSPFAPSSTYGSPELQRQSLPTHSYPHPSLRTSPEIHRESIASQTPTTARSSPDFPRDILNSGAPPAVHSSPHERKSSTPGSSHPGDVRKRPNTMSVMSQIEQAQMRASPDNVAGQKRKADGSPDAVFLQKQPRTDVATTNGQNEPGSQHIGPLQMRGAQHARQSPYRISKSPSPSEVRNQPKPNGVPAKPERKRWLEPPIWAQRTPLGKKRIVPGLPPAEQRLHSNGRTPASITPELKQEVKPESKPETRPPEARIYEQDGKREANLTGEGSVNNLVRILSELIWGNVISQDQFEDNGPAKASWEVEAKLGTIINRDTNDRYSNGAITECILAQDISNIRFESGFQINDFKTLNDYLNRQVGRSQQPGRVPIQYSHPQEVDTFYQLTRAGREHLPPVVRHYLDQSRHQPKLRVTKNKKTDAITAKIIKARMTDMHILCPQNKFDIRVSISLEISWNGAVEDLGDSPQDQRDKNRLSYTHQASHIDLTQVKTTTHGMAHEVEIELDVEMLKVEAAKLESEGTAPFEALVAQLVDNTMVLNRAAAAPPGPGAR